MSLKVGNNCSIKTFFYKPHFFHDLQVAAASGLIDGGGESVGEFKRSSSARLHRNKRNHPEFFNLGMYTYKDLYQV